jgi:hypothetical protein
MRLSRLWQQRSLYVSRCIVCIRAVLGGPAKALLIRVRHAWVRLTIGFVVLSLTVSFIGAGYSEWKKTVSATKFCYRVPTDFWQHFRYMQLTIDSQSLSYPEFEGRYRITLGKETGNNISSLIITQIGKREYGSTLLSPQFSWDDVDGPIMRDTNASISFLTQDNHSHYLFPFDSAHFEETFKFEPALNIRAVLFLNRVPGFYLPCKTIQVVTNEGSATISFELRRNRLIVYTAVLLFVVAALFAILITLFAESGPLPGALASYFFALWSVRALFALTTEGFPTLFDIGIVLLASLIPVLLLLRVLGLPVAFTPLRHYGGNLVRKLEGRSPLPAPGS